MSTKITVAGMITDPMFHKSVAIARGLEAKHPELLAVEVFQYFETQWMIYLKKLSNDLKGVFYKHDDRSPIIYLDGKDYIGDADNFAQWALYNFNYTESDGITTYTKVAKDAQILAINNSQTRSYVFMTFKYDQGQNKE